uniref:Inositol polyphosphate multikinase n=1 Tax=Tetradesmus obliquus TaxID=3088 RepID=A0A383WJ42_TETOB|eukprot:jgi/Sobl393_1/1271/SZX77179.1
MDCDLQPYEYQVGGHSKTDGQPASLKDNQGRFLKRLQAGERGDREVAFYAAIEQHRQQVDPAATEGGSSSSSSSSADPGQSAAAGSADDDDDAQAAGIMQRLAQWVPKSFGVRQVCGTPYLVLEDLTGQYRQPCILDVKLGFRTWYPWASDSLQQKYRAKDESTTQASLGFRVCGVMGAAGSSGQAWRADRHWGKTLTADTVGEAFTRFADNGVLSLADLLLGRGMLLDQLQALADLAAVQDCWHMYSSSLLVVYEGSAATAAEARLATRLIDFAHTFPTAKASKLLHKQQQQQQQPVIRIDAKEEQAALSADGPCGVDENFAAGLRSLIQVLQQTLDQQQQGQQH